MDSMKRKKKVALWIVAPLVLVAFFVLRCGGSKPAQRRATQPVTHVALSPDARRDLTRDEDRGGHTLERHIGKTDAQLRERLAEESISADSTYNDRDTAEMAVAASIRENSSRIDSWLRRPGGHSNLVLDYDSSSPLGRSMRRDEAASFPCSHAVVILKWLGPADYFVLTSYPDCWRPQ
jgi:hypothetical protein